MNRRIILFLLLNVTIFSAFAETVYKSRDAEGNVIFSDVPSEGAETIEIEEAQTINIPEPVRLRDRPATKLSPKEISYNRFEIITPENDATIRSNEGIVNIGIEMSPVLDEKHIIVFMMDGQQVSSGKALQLSLKEIDRGTHTVSALIMNENKEVLKHSNTSTFHLKKHSKLFKNNANNNGDKPGNTTVLPEASANETTPPAAPKIPSL
jgi:hypothetical protein